MSSQADRIKLNINRLRKGIYIELPVGWSKHPFLFNQFCISSNKQIEILRRLNISYVYALPDKSSIGPIPMTEIEVPEKFTSELDLELANDIKRLEADKRKKMDEMQAYRRKLKKCESNYQIAISRVRALTMKVESRPLEAMEEATDIINSMVDTLSAKDDMVIHLVGDDRDDMGMHQHAVSVSLLSMMIGRKLKLSKSQLTELGIAGLLHDIGKLKIPSQFYTSTDISSKKRRFVIEQHPSYSVNYLNCSTFFSDTVKAIVAEHHEFADGSGYPKQKNISRLNPLSLIVSLVNYYERLCYPYDNTKPLTRSRALSYIFKSKQNLFEPEQLNAFIKTMGIYPPGTLVKLSNGQVGIVVTVNSSKLLFPNVLIYDEEIPRHDAVIIDTEKENICIGGIVAESSLPKSVIEYLNPRTKINFYFD